MSGTHAWNRAAGAIALPWFIFAVSSSPVSAQPIDYGSLEALFGEPVTTSVTGSPQRASEVPASMIIVTADDIRRSGARDIPGVLRHVPGLDVLQWASDDSDVAVRGYNQAYSSRLLVLVNGRQVYADYYGYTPWSTVPVELADIRQIEVVLGPNSALFGFNAAGGVINIVTYDPLYDDVAAVSVSGGTQNLVQGSAVATFKLGDDAGLRVSFGGRNNDDFSTVQPAADIGSRQGDSREAADALLHVRFDDDTDASLELSHSEVMQDEIAPSYTAYSLRYRLTSIQARLASETGLGLIQASAYANWFRAFSQSPGPTLPIFRQNNPVYVAQLQDIFKIGSAHTFRLSAEYRHTDMQTTPLAGAHVFYDVYSASGMWNWSILPDLALTNALRIDSLFLGRNGDIPPGLGLTNADWNNRSLTEDSFNSGLVWQADDEDSVRLSVARGVQLPNLLDFGGLLLPLPPLGYVAGIPNLEPTAVMNYEAGWDRDLPSWDARLTLHVFHEETRNITANGVPSPPGQPIALAPLNIGNSQATGLELSLTGHFSEAWRWGLSYTPETIEDHFLPGISLANTAVDYQHTNPVHVVKANLGWSDGPWETDLYLQYQSHTDSIRGSSGLNLTGTLVPIASLVTMDGRIAYRIDDHLTLSLSGQNLLQSPQKQTSAADVERSVYVTLTLSN